MDGERISAWRGVIAGLQATMDESHIADVHRFCSAVLDSHSDRLRHLQFKGRFRPTRSPHHGKHRPRHDTLDFCD